MTLNDFKAVEGDRQMGVRSLPVQMGVQAAGRFACWSMAVPQVIVVLLLIGWGHPMHALAVLALLALQLVLMDHFLARTSPAAHCWYSGFGVPLVRGRHDGQRLRAARRHRGSGRMSSTCTRRTAARSMEARL
jgi:chlorophyll synthase